MHVHSGIFIQILSWAWIDLKLGTMFQKSIERQTQVLQYESDLSADTVL